MTISDRVDRQRPQRRNGRLSRLARGEPMGDCSRAKNTRVVQKEGFSRIILSQCGNREMSHSSGFRSSSSRGCRSGPQIGDWLVGRTCVRLSTRGRTARAMQPTASFTGREGVVRRYLAPGDWSKITLLLWSIKNCAVACLRLENGCLPDLRYQ